MKHIIRLTLCLIALLALSFQPAMAEDEVYSQERLQQLLAPIALYPDTVLTHVLIAATYPIEVVQADRWAQKHSNLKGEDAINAATGEDWDPSVKALLAFPDLLKRMSEDLLWTQDVGEAFLADESATLDAIQQLRQQAWESGTFDDMEHLRAAKEEQQIVIQPVTREIVYVPYYDSRVVYGAWHWSAYPPVYWPRPPRYTGGFYWGYYAPVGDWFYVGGFHWSHRYVAVNYRRPYYSWDRHYHRDDHWRHNPYHRRGARYHHEVVRNSWGHGGRHINSNPGGQRNSAERHQRVVEQLPQHRSRAEAIERTNPSARTSAVQGQRRVENIDRSQIYRGNQPQTTERLRVNPAVRTPTNVAPAANNEIRRPSQRIEVQRVEPVRQTTSPSRTLPSASRSDTSNVQRTSPAPQRSSGGTRDAGAMRGGRFRD